MALPDIFSAGVSEQFVQRIEQLQPDTRPLWGKMDVAQMLAHCCVTYEMIYENKHPKPGALGRLMLKWFVKNTVVSETPYTHNKRTAPAFMIAGPRDFVQEKQRLIDYIRRTQALGGAHFDGKESHSFGPLTRSEWNNMLYKHLDHHLGQFGV